MPHAPLAAPWTPLSPSAGNPNSYSGLAILAVLLLATGATALGVRAFANGATRRGPAWDCGFPDANPITQYTAGSFAQPIRRVFGSIVFRAREQVVIPKPGETAAAQFVVTLHDPAWDVFYAPVAKGVAFAAGHLNRLQFLTIRRYLAVVFATLVFLLSVLALWL